MTSEPEPPAVDGGWPPWVQTWVMPYVRESALWPVLVATEFKPWSLFEPASMAQTRQFGKPGTDIHRTVQHLLGDGINSAQFFQINLARCQTQYAGALFTFAIVASS